MTAIDISSLKIEAWDPAEVRPSPKNHKRHTAESVHRLAQSMDRLGQLQPILVDKTGEIIAGHGRLEAAKLLGWLKVKVIQLPVDRGTAIEMRIADNMTSNQDIDLDALKNDLRDALEADPTLNIHVLFQDAKLADVLDAELKNIEINLDALSADIAADVGAFADENDKRMSDIEQEDMSLRSVFGFTKVSPGQARVLKTLVGVAVKETGINEPAEALVAWVEENLS